MGRYFEAALRIAIARCRPKARVSTKALVVSRCLCVTVLNLIEKIIYV